MLPKAGDGVIWVQFPVSTREGASGGVVDFLELDPAADLEMPDGVCRSVDVAIMVGELGGRVRFTLWLFGRASSSLGLP